MATDEDRAASFRDLLEGIAELAEVLRDSCVTTEELVGVAKLALKNDGQLRILMSLAAARDTGKKR